MTDQVVRGEGRDLLPVPGVADQPGEPPAAVRAVEDRRRVSASDRGLQGPARPGAVSPKLHARPPRRQLRLRSLRQVNLLRPRRLCAPFFPSIPQFVDAPPVDAWFYWLIRGVAGS